MPNATIVKDVGHGPAIKILTVKSEFHYPTEADGCSSHFGVSEDLLALHFTGTPNLTIANGILTAIDLPTCEVVSGLTVRVNVGTYLVNDDTLLSASPTEAKEFRICVAMDDTTGNLEVIVMSRAPGEEYGALPTGKTLGAHLKEYSLIINGTTLVETLNRIE